LIYVSWRKLDNSIETELNDNNIIRLIKTKMIPVPAFPTNICKFNKGELLELDQVVKRELREADVYQKTRLRVACYMCMSTNKWIRGEEKR